MRQYDRAIASELACIRREPDSVWAHVILGWAYQQKGMHQEALAALENAVKLAPGFAFGLAAYGQALAASGDREGATAVLAQLEQKAKTGYVSSYDVAMIYAALGARDEAFRLIDRAIAERASFLPLITWDRRADVLRADPRYAELIRKLNLQDFPLQR